MLCCCQFRSITIPSLGEAPHNTHKLLYTVGQSVHFKQLLTYCPSLLCHVMHYCFCLPSFVFHLLWFSWSSPSPCFPTLTLAVHLCLNGSLYLSSSLWLGQCMLVLPQYHCTGVICLLDLKCSTFFVHKIYSPPFVPFAFLNCVVTCFLALNPSWFLDYVGVVCLSDISRMLI